MAVKFLFRFYKNPNIIHNKIDALRREHRKAIEGVLNDAQRNRFSNVYNDRWGGWGRGYGRRHMGNFYGQGYGTGYCSGLYSSSEYMRQGDGAGHDGLLTLEAPSGIPRERFGLDLENKI